MTEVCPPPCTEIYYDTFTKSIVHEDPTMALILMYYQKDRMSIQEEYLIFDFSAIIVAVGGSLGLFLGFSFFQCGSLMLDESIEMTKKMMRKLRGQF